MYVLRFTLVSLLARYIPVKCHLVWRYLDPPPNPLPPKKVAGREPCNNAACKEWCYCLCQVIGRIQKYWKSSAVVALQALAVQESLSK